MNLYACCVCGNRFLAEEYLHANCLSCFSSVIMLSKGIKKKEVDNLKACGVPQYS